MFSSAHARRRRRARGRFGMAGGQRRLNAGLVLGVLALVVSAVSQCTGGVLTLNRVDLKVLVLSAENPAFPDSPLNPTNERAIARELQSEGVPTRVINLNDANRPTIDAAFLAQTIGTNPVIERSYYQAIVVPNSQVDANYKGSKPLTAAEYQAISDWEIKFGIREVVANTYAHAEVGLTNPVGLDPTGQTATVTAAGLAGPFKYLKGTFTFDTGSFAGPSAPLNADFTPLVNLPAGTIVGTYNTGGRERLIFTTNYLYAQNSFQAMAHGIVTWMTKGVHLGYDRSYFTMHADDVFAEDSRWSTTGNCTPGEDCPTGVTTPTIRMNAADVANLVAWQNTWKLPIVQVFNGFYAFNEDLGGATDPLSTAYKANASQLQWINHTYDHEFLGCVQNTTTIPWSCTTVGGQVQYVSQAKIVQEINDNKTVATNTLGLTSANYNPTELVTGEHSGLYILPQQPADNPNLAPALTATGIKTTAADASRQNDPRTVGSARTVPRHPINIFFNTATKAEAVDEYNWIFTSAADGGSGICTANGFQCIAPVSNFDTQIVPANTAQAMQYVLANDPRPTYAHVSNLTEDRLLLTQLQSILTTYNATFATSAPLVSQTQTAASQTLDAQYAWNTALANNQVEAYTIGNQVYLSTTGGYTGQVPVTAPTGTKTGTLAAGPAFGQTYGGESSAWISVVPSPNQTYLLLPSA